ncbi:MAG: RDD family protein [Betaproteobacteria bacterium]|nr:RDD family protein [Betaproteobacteria bacterium]
MIQDESPKSSFSNIPAKPIVVGLAGLRRRLVGMLYELVLLVGILAVGFLLPWMLLFSQLGLKNPPAWMGWLELLHVLALLGAYFVYSWHRLGQTLAMRTWRLRVVAANGNKLSWGRAFLRYVLAWPSVLCFGVGILWAFFDLDNLFLHDRLAGTRVVVLPKGAAAGNITVAT